VYFWNKEYIIWVQGVSLIVHSLFVPSSIAAVSVEQVMGIVLQ
jgi:hypothetical protein